MPVSGIWFYMLRNELGGKKVVSPQNQSVLIYYEVKMLQDFFLITNLCDSGLNNVDVKRSDRSVLPNEIWLVRQSSVHS